MKHQKITLPVVLFILFHSFAHAGEKPANDSITLNPVIVTGTQISTNINTVPASVTVITRKDIEKTEESSVLSSLKGLVPGLFITERGTTGFGIFTGSGGSISLRGIGGTPTTQVLIAIDGHPQMMGINGHDLPDAYVSYNAENIEVIRGPASTVYGSNAMGGVINIITREEKTNGFRANASMMAGSYNTQKYLISLRLKKDKFSGFVSSNYDKTDGHREHSAFNLFNTYAKIGYALSGHYKATADFSLSDYRSTDPGPITHPAISDSLTADVTRGMASLTLDNQFDETSGKIKLYYDFGHHEIYDGWQSDDINAGLTANQSIAPWKGSVFTLG
ncbi:MAG: TonB-dependent receptor plug domain-containing protein, partial [Bacteroidales bacterium]|nr:TonB-dependent receptor plug domain-containing protein [Bacteroidales bacterium]